MLANVNTAFNPAAALCFAPFPQELMRLVLTDVDVSRHPLGKDAPVAELLTGPPADGLPLWPHPTRLPDFQPVMLAYFAAMNSLADRLIRLAAQALGLNPEAFLEDDAAQTLPAWQTLLLLHYPPTPTDAVAGQYACGPHKDRFTQVGCDRGPLQAALYPVHPMLLYDSIMAVQCTLGLLQ